MKILNDFVLNEAKNKIVLSIGCVGYSEAGTEGSQLSIIKNISKTWYGLDNNEEYIKENNQNNNLFFGDLNKFDYFDLLPNDIEIILLTEVLEHVISPIETLKYILKNKGDNCKILISVPNGGSLGRFIMGILKSKMHKFQDRHHLCVFNQITIENVCKIATLNITEFYPYVHSNIHKILLNRFSSLASGYIIVGH